MRYCLAFLLMFSILFAQAQAPKKLSRKEKQALKKELAKQENDAKLAEKKKKAAAKIEIDSTFIDPLTHQFQLKFYGVNNYNQITLNNTESKDFLNYNANITPVFGVGVKIKGITVQSSFWKPFKEQDLANKGASNYRDIQIFLSNKKVQYDINFQYLKGYYLSNSNSIFDTLKSNSFNYLRPDLRVYGFRFNPTYNILSKKYSFKAAFSESERQLKSAGSPLCAFGIDFNRIKGDSLILPSIFEDYFDKNFGFISSSSYNLHTGFGYAYTFVFLKNCFFSLAIVPQLNLQVVSFDRQNLGIETNVRFGVLGQGRASLVINTKKLYLGISLVYNSVPNGKLGNVNYNYNYGILKASVIHRFTFKKIRSKKKANM